MSRTILVVDDNADERNALGVLLQNEYSILTAKSGREMISVLRNKARSISAIILEIKMSDMDGFEALREIRENAIYRQIPVIVTTELSDEKSQIRAMELGANGYVLKPINKDLLGYTLRNAIELCEKSSLLDAFRNDALTGLPNRMSFFEAAELMVKRNNLGHYIISCLDIENFKVINDQYGVKTGDDVLKHIADSIGKCVTQLGGVCCRYSADKFGMIYPASFKDSKIIKQLHEDVISSEHSGRKIKIRIGRYIVDDLSVPVSAMYDRATLAEEAIRGRYDVYIAEYSDSMRNRLLNEQKIVNDMDRALVEGEFETWLQPQYNHATGALIGAEALVRWRKKNGSFISPAEFIPVFERNGFIYEMDQYIWEQVCKLLRRHIDAGASPLPISVNVSRRDLFHKHFISVLTGIVNKYNIPYDLLRLEVTESAFAESTGQIVAKVVELINLGFTVEIDDFGSGYSSLNTLKDVPASILKLDMKFFENTKDHQRGGNIIESVVRMAKWLGMAVIAEGVEEKEQADYLKSIGCYYIQGYFYAKPMPITDYEKLLAGNIKEPKLTRLETLETLDNNEFWNPKSMETLIFNSYVGGACIFEYHDGKTELLRTNEQYAHEFGGLLPSDATLQESSIAKFLDDENKKVANENIHKAIETKNESVCELNLTDGKQVEYVRMTVRVIAHAAQHYLFYGVMVNMTRQRDAERKQLESARQLEFIMHNINGGVSAILIADDGTSKLVFTNDKYYELYGYTKERALAENLDVMTTIVPEDIPPVMEKVKKLKKDGIPAIIDYRCVKSDGRLAFLRANSSLMYMYGYGEVITSVITDITEKRALEDQLSAIVDNIYGGVTATVIRNGKPEFIVVNDQFFKMLGYSTREEYYADHPDKYTGLHPDDKQRIIKQFESSDGGKKQYTMEYRILRKDGEVRYVRNNIRVVNLFGVDEPVQLSVVNDITQQLQAERKEREAVDKLSAVLGHAGNGITAIELRGDNPDFLFVNDIYFEIVGYTKKEYAEITKDDLFAHVHPDDRNRVRNAILDLNKETGSLTIEYRVIRADGNTVWLKSVVTLTKLASVNFPVQIAMHSDITAEKETNNQLRFLNDLAHDILAQPDCNIAIDKTLENVMAYFGGDRSYVIELDNIKHVSNNTYEKCAQGVTSEIDRLQNVPFDVSAYWFVAFNNHEFIAIDDVENLDDSKAELRELLLSQNIHSIIVSPLWRDGVVVGFVGVDNPSRAVNQLDRLQAIGDYIAILMTRRDLNRRIENNIRDMQMLIDDTPGGFLRMEIHSGANPTIISINEGLCRMLGMKRDEIMQEYGNNAYKCLVEEDIANILTESADAIANCGQFTSKCRMRRKDGTFLWVMVFGRFVNDDGKLFLNSYFTDITEQKKSEQQQIELLDNLPTGAALYEYDGCNLSVIHINKSYWQLVGREPVDYSKASVFGVIHHDDTMIVHQEIGAAIRQKRNVQVDIRILCGKFIYRPFHIDAKIMPQANGKYLFFTSYTPISDQTMSIQEMLPVALSTMMSASKDLSYVKDKDLHYICCSQSVADLLGFDSTRDIIGKTDYDLFDKKVADRFIERDKRIIECGESIINHTERMPRSDGSSLLVSSSKYPIMDAYGNVIGLYGASRDITAQREKESQLELLTSSIPGGLATFRCLSGKYRLEYYNDGFCSLFGYTREEFDAEVTEPMDFIFEEDRAEIESQIDMLIKENKPIDCVYRVHMKDGGYKWLSHKANVVEIEDESIMVNAVFLDVTQQQTEKERLRVSEELNRLAIQHSGNIITRFDVQSRTLTLPNSFNPIFVLPQVLNNMPEEQIALGRVSPDTADAYRELFAEITRGEHDGTATYKQNSSKGWRWLEAHYTTVFSNTSKPVSAVISFSDITEKLEKEIVYNKWQQSLNERSKNSYSLFRCNISKGTAYDSCEGSLLNNTVFDDAQITFDEQAVEYACRYVYEKDRENYMKFLNSNTMLAEYYRGHRSDMLEYREVDANGHMRWLSLTVDLVEYPSSNDIEAYLMYENIDEQKKSELLTIERSEKDPLTGIFNRSAFIARMENILLSSVPGTKHALFMLDVDNFKNINDTLGHGAGDQVLRNLTEKINSVLRSDDLLGRLGGDEFFVFLNDMADEAAAYEKAKQICSLDVSLKDAGYNVTTSIGITMIPKDGNNFDTLYKKVDHALYRIKKTGKKSFAFYDEKADALEEQ